MIVGIGWSKSGTHSLCAALSRMGAKCCHLGDDEDSRQAIAANTTAGRPIFAGLEQFDAFADWPVVGLWRHIAEQYTDARFILTYRPPADVAWSWVRQLHSQPEVIQPHWATRFSDVAAEVEQHVSDVCQHFLGDRDRLLLLDQRDDDAVKWRLLAQFTGLTAPDGVAFPHEFAHRQWHVSGLR